VSLIVGRSIQVVHVIPVAKQNQPALMTLHATEFIRRLLLHVLPKGLVRIRHFGFLANLRHSEIFWRRQRLTREIVWEILSRRSNRLAQFPSMPPPKPAKCKSISVNLLLPIQDIRQPMLPAVQIMNACDQLAVAEFLDLLNRRDRRRGRMDDE
jgi:Putative transposase